jgi:hypothetical protein
VTLGIILRDLLGAILCMGADIMSNNASPLVILAVLHEELTKRGDRVHSSQSTD